MKIIQKELKDVMPEAYLPYSAYVIQTRALPDARDCLKTGGRYILWSQYVNKNTYDKPRKKGADIQGACMHWNPHGDAGIYDAVVRMAKPYSMRYPLEDPKGNVGTITSGKDFAAPRYLELRSAKLASEFTNLVKKNAVDIWKLNHDGTDKYPSVFPTLFPNFVNGNVGIGVGCISNIPCFNLDEAVESLKKLVHDPNTSYDDIYIEPDFPTGAIIINGNEVKESLKVGEGKSVKMRAVINYDETDNALVVTELPYQIFTDRVMGEIEKGIDDGKITGIKNYYDGTDRSCGKWRCKVVIFLNKGVNPEKVCRQLYKNTSLQSHFTIKQNMLTDGIKPELYGLKEMMLAYLNHAMHCLKKSYQYDYDAILKAKKINEGLLVAIAHIDEVVALIKEAESEQVIYDTFKEKYGLSEEQSKAICDLKLRRLMKLESVKINKDIEKQESELSELEKYISDKETFKTKFIAELDRIKKEYGDERRTKVINLDFTSEDEDAEPVERKELLITYTNLGNIYAQETTTLIAQKRGGKGTNFKLKADEYVTQSISTDNMGWLYAFTNKGKMYSVMTDSITLGRNNASVLFGLEAGEKVSYINTFSKKSVGNYFYFITKDGMIKKTAVSEYKSQKKGIIAIKLKDGDEVVTVFAANGGNIGVLSSSGKFIVFDGSEVSDTGRNTAGVRAIKLKDGESVISAAKIMGDNLVTVTEYGMVKKTSMSEFNTQGRGGTGVSISGVSTNDKVVDFLTFREDCDIMIISSKKNIKIPSTQISTQSRTGKGSKGITLDEKEKVKSIVKA